MSAIGNTPYNRYCSQLDSYVAELKLTANDFIKRDKTENLSKAIFELYLSYMIPLIQMLDQDRPIAVIRECADFCDQEYGRSDEDRASSNSQGSILSRTIKEIKEVTQKSKMEILDKTDEEVFKLASKIEEIKDYFLTSKISCVRSSEPIFFYKETVKEYSQELFDKIIEIIVLGEYQGDDENQEWTDIATVLANSASDERVERISQYIQEFSLRIEVLKSQDLIRKYSQELFDKMEEAIRLDENEEEDEKDKEWIEIGKKLQKVSDSRRDQKILKYINRFDERIKALESSDDERGIYD